MLYHHTVVIKERRDVAHTMYVIGLSNISIKTNFKQITRVTIRLTNVIIGM
jgi:hypothetical protein